MFDIRIGIIKITKLLNIEPSSILTDVFFLSACCQRIPDMPTEDLDVVPLKSDGWDYPASFPSAGQDVPRE